MKLYWVVVCLLASCGSEKSAVEKCDDLIDVTCDRVLECVPGSGTHADCVGQVQTQLPCGSAKKVSASYNRCMTQMRDNSCAVLFPGGQLQLPADCQGVILTRELPGGNSSPLLEQSELIIGVEE